MRFCEALFIQEISPRSILAVVFLAAFAGGASSAWAQPPGECPIPPAGEAELINSAMTTRLYGGPLMQPEVNSLEHLKDRLRDITMPVELFWNAYDSLEVVDHSYECLDDPECVYNYVTVTYDIGDEHCNAFAYFRGSQGVEKGNAALIIPGSGSNQSSAIYMNEPANYHYNIAEIVTKHYDMFVYVKPNEDFLAIHNGQDKLNQEYIIRPFLNAGGSYSCRYLIDTMAMVKFLKNTYDRVAVIGLSQGGEAALYNSLQSHPTGAIVASGFTVLGERFSDGGLGQIIIPGMKDYYGNEEIYEGIEGSETRYLFTWGRMEGGLYGVDADLGCTRDFFAQLPNVTCAIHGAGHQFPAAEVGEFLLSLTHLPVEAARMTLVSQNEPNPFSGQTRIRFALEKEAKVQLQVFDAKGRLVRELVNDVLEPDDYVAEWDGRSDYGAKLPSGVYFYRLQLPGWSASRKMVLLR